MKLEKAFKNDLITVQLNLARDKNLRIIITKYLINFNLQNKNIKTV